MLSDDLSEMVSGSPVVRTSRLCSMTLNPLVGPCQLRPMRRVSQLLPPVLLTSWKWLWSIRLYWETLPGVCGSSRPVPSIITMLALAFTGPRSL